MRNPLSSPVKSLPQSDKLAREEKSSKKMAVSSGKTLCCSKVGMKRGPWTPEEDELLSSYIKREGEGRWRTLPKKAGLLRCGKSCRLRWMNYLRPCVKRGHISPDEEDLIVRLHRLLGNRWSLIAGRLPGRTDNEIKNYWNTHLSKKLISQGIDPRTHKPLSSPSSSLNPNHSNNYLPNAFQNTSNLNSNDFTNLAPPALLSSTEKGHDQTDQLTSNEDCHVDDPYDIKNHLQDDIFSSFLDSLIDEEIRNGGETSLVQPKHDDQEAKVNDLDIHLFISSYSQTIFNFGGDGWDAPLMSASGSASANQHDDIDNFNQNV